MKELWKSVNIWRSHGREYSVSFFDSQCIVCGIIDYMCIELLQWQPDSVILSFAYYFILYLSAILF